MSNSKLRHWRSMILLYVIAAKQMLIKLCYVCVFDVKAKIPSLSLCKQGSEEQ